MKDLTSSDADALIADLGAKARAAAAAKASKGPDAARSQDFLYDERGTPA